MPTPTTVYLIGDTNALKAIPASDRTEGYTLLALSIIDGTHSWYSFKNNSITPPDNNLVLLPNDNPTTGRWHKSNTYPKLTADLLLYIATTGSDANNGTFNTPFGTIQHFINIASYFDTNGFNITGAISSGTYTESLVLKPFIGSGYIRISGLPNNTVTLAPTTGACVKGNYSTGKYQIDNIKLSSSDDARIYLEPAGYLEYFNITFSGTSLIDHITIGGSGVIVKQTGDCTIESGGYSHVYAYDGANFRSSALYNLVGNPNFSDAFIWVVVKGCVEWYGNFTGSATGRKFRVRLSGIVYANSADLNYLPGDTDGLVETGGIYIRSDGTSILPSPIAADKIISRGSFGSIRPIDNVNVAFEAFGFGDIESAFVIRQAGRIDWGAGGSAPPDTFLERDTPQSLKTNATFNSNSYRIGSLQTPPASATDTGSTGEIRWTSNAIYLCIAPNTWVRSLLTSF